MFWECFQSFWMHWMHFCNLAASLRSCYYELHSDFTTTAMLKATHCCFSNSPGGRLSRRNMAWSSLLVLVVTETERALVGHCWLACYNRYEAQQQQSSPLPSHPTTHTSCCLHKGSSVLLLHLPANSSSCHRSLLYRYTG